MGLGGVQRCPQDLASSQEACDPEGAIFPVACKMHETVFNSTRGSAIGAWVIRGLGEGQRINNVRE